MQLAARFRAPGDHAHRHAGRLPRAGAEERGQSEAIARNILEMAALADADRRRGHRRGRLRRRARARRGRPRADARELGLLGDLARGLRRDPVEGRHASGSAPPRRSSSPPTTCSRLGLIDEIIPEPSGGAHADPDAAGERSLRDARWSATSTNCARLPPRSCVKRAAAAEKYLRWAAYDGSLDVTGPDRRSRFKGNRTEFFDWHDARGSPPPATRRSSSRPTAASTSVASSTGRRAALENGAAPRGAAPACGGSGGRPRRRERRPRSRCVQAARRQRRRSRRSPTSCGAARTTSAAARIERVRRHDLEMKVSDTEWQWDRNRLTLYFTAEKRVDFRNLVRDLAAMFRTRIELRQIGVRDEAERLDGVGRCGRQYCCSTWLTGAAPRSSSQLAKDQRLSLNPSQISGACGRLLCCLRYEHEFYVQRRKRFPKEGKIRRGPRGAPRRSSPSTSSGSGSRCAARTRRPASCRSPTCARRWNRPAPDCRNRRRASRRSRTATPGSARITVHPPATGPECRRSSGGTREPRPGGRSRTRQRTPEVPPQRAGAGAAAAPQARPGAGRARRSADSRGGEWPVLPHHRDRLRQRRPAPRPRPREDRRRLPSRGTTACAATRCTSSWAWTSTARRWPRPPRSADCRPSSGSTALPPGSSRPGATCSAATTTGSGPPSPATPRRPALIERIQANVTPTTSSSASTRGCTASAARSSSGKARSSTATASSTRRATWSGPGSDNWFFRLTRYRDQLLQLIRTGEFPVEPAIRRNEILRLLEEGLQDISVSRGPASVGHPLPRRQRPHRLCLVRRADQLPLAPPDIPTRAGKRSGPPTST